MRRAQISLLVALGVPVGIGARATPIPLGSRVRVETRQDSKVVGTLMSQTTDSVIVAAPGAVRTVVPLASVVRIRVSEGRSHERGAGRGMMFGAAIGGGGFGLAVLATDPAWAPAALLAGALGGAMWGAVIGAIVGAERWTTVYSSPVRVSFRPAPSGAPSLGVSIRF